LFSEFVGIVPVINIQGYVYILMGVIVLIALRSQRAQRVEAPLNTTAALHNE
jgi:hypothetical protein